MVAKKYIYGEEARKALLDGIETVVKNVSVTMGPKGRNVVFETSQWAAPKVTKDGVTVAKQVELKGFPAQGAKLVREVASKAADMAGDGTTTATVLTGALVREGVKSVAAGLNPMDLKRGIDKAVEAVVEDLQKRSKEVSNNTEIRQIATISANGDTEIGDFIAQAMEKVGKDGVITVEEAQGFKTELVVVEGMQFDKGYVSPFFMTNAEKNTCELDQPYILLAEGSVSSLAPVLPLLEKIAQSQKPLLIIAEDIEGEALATLIMNKMRGTLKCCAVKAPGYGDRRKEMMQDISVLTAGTYISQELGKKLENTQLTDLGRCKRVIISKDETTIVDGAGDKAAISERCDQIRTYINDAKTDYDKERLKERLAKLSGGIAIIRVGGSTEVEVKERKDRVDDAVAATKAAVEEGIVAGGGSALLYSIRVLESLKLPNADQQAGVDIVKKALEVPTKHIVTNSGGKAELVIGKLLESKDTNFGYDAQNDRYVDMVKEGIIDPTKVVRVALENAASVAALVITTESLIIEDQEEKERLMKMPAQQPMM